MHTLEIQTSYEIYVQTKRNRSTLWEVKAQFVCLFVFLLGWGGGGYNLGHLLGNGNDLIMGGRVWHTRKKSPKAGSSECPVYNPTSYPVSVGNKLS